MGRAHSHVQTGESVSVEVSDVGECVAEARVFAAQIVAFRRRHRPTRDSLMPSFGRYTLNTRDNIDVRWTAFLGTFNTLQLIRGTVLATQQ